MPRHADFMSAIIADKASDTPRLIYADWLEETGNANHADFIRVQCELATLGSCAVEPPCRSRLDYACRVCELHAREAELWGRYPDVNDLRQHFHASMPAVAEPMGWCILPQGYNDFGNHTPSAVVARGFVAAVRCDLATWLSVADALTTTQPVESVALTSMSLGDVETLAQRHYVRYFWPPSAIHRTAADLLNRSWPRITFTLPQGFRIR